MEQADFEQCIAGALQTIPQELRSRIENVAFIVEQGSRPPHGQERSIRHQHVLLGLYQGIPYSRRGSGYSMVLPDRITLFQATIEEVAGGDPERICELVTDVVLHEVAHYFGFSESDVRAIERQRQEKREKRRTPR
jgi:predicted Zn-dependent protease with MMP-like domain